MKKLILITLILIFGVTAASAQSNRIVFGPLEGDDAGVLTVHNGLLNLELEVWVRTDPDNPAPITGMAHALLSEDEVILNRNGHTWDPDYDSPDWQVWVNLYVHDPNDNYPIPEGHTTEVTTGIWECCPGGGPLDTFGEWDYYGSFWMDINTGLEEEQTYSPFSRGWLPNSNQSTNWAFMAPPGGSIVPEQDYSDLYVTSVCIYIPGDCNHNGTPLELEDALIIVSIYRGDVDPYYTCECPSHGSDFAPGADPDGNCIPFEIGDVVTEISAYRGLAEVSGCPDCPGSGELAIGESEGR